MTPSVFCPKLFFLDDFALPSFVPLIYPHKP